MTRLKSKAFPALLNEKNRLIETIYTPIYLSFDGEN